MSEKKSQIGEFGEILNYNRRPARDLAFKYIFQWNVIGDDVVENMAELENMDFKPTDSGYIRAVVKGVTDNCGSLDAIIEENSKGWKKGRISNVCMAAMRLALYEMMYDDDISDSISINEAVELIKTYDSPEAAAFANGILGSVQKKRAKESES